MWVHADIMLTQTKKKGTHFSWLRKPKAPRALRLSTSLLSGNANVLQVLLSLSVVRPFFSLELFGVPTKRAILLSFLFKRITGFAFSWLYNYELSKKSWHTLRNNSMKEIMTYEEKLYLTKFPEYFYIQDVYRLCWVSYVSAVWSVWVPQCNSQYFTACSL